MSRPILSVVQQHAEEAASLRDLRTSLLEAPHVKPHDLKRLDDRLLAHLDGLTVAGDDGRACSEAALDSPGVGPAFAVTVGALEDKSASTLGRMLALAEAAPKARPGVFSAFGWVSAQQLQGTARDLLGAHEAFHRLAGITACTLHRVNGGAALQAALDDDNVPLRQRAARAAGELGRVDLLSDLQRSARNHADPALRFWSVWSALLLGERERPLATLVEMALADSIWSSRALRLAMLGHAPRSARAQLAALSQAQDQSPIHKRRLIRACGYVGDVHYSPWLIDLMSEDTLSRLAGESFSMITGADLAKPDLERSPPEGFESGPNDDPNDDNVAMDEDDGLPWPDQAKVQAWWQREAHRFQPGVRYLLGAPPSWEHCIEVLKTGYQRQRIVAAQMLCLLRPGTVLFNTAAPAWRQQRLLASLA